MVQFRKRGKCRSVVDLMNRNIKDDLHGIDYVCYFKNGYKYINVIDMSDESTVENTGDSWCEAA